MKCRCGNEHSNDSRQFSPIYYHRLPWPVKTCNGSYRGEWTHHSVGPNIPSAWKAVVAVIIYKLTSKIWAGAFDSPKPIHKGWMNCPPHHLCRRGHAPCALSHGTVQCCRCAAVYCRWVTAHLVPDGEFDKEHDDASD